MERAKSGTFSYSFEKS